MPPHADPDLATAVVNYWKVKANQLTAAQAAQSTAEGTAKAVRGGGHFAPIAALIAKFFLDAGYPEESIRTGQRDPKTTLPGFFRPSKDWDLVVGYEGILVAAIELKALGAGAKADAFGKNYNNRVEEALGNSMDLSRANLESLVGPEAPWFGYFFIMEDHAQSRRSLGRPRSVPFFDRAPEWIGPSYQERFAITGRRLLDEKLYDAVCYLVSSEADPGPLEPSGRLDWQHFTAALNARISYLAGLGYP